MLSRYTHDRLGSAIASVRFRAGRIDAVWGVELDDGRAVVVKAHRRPVDLEAVAAATRAQALLVAAGHPCPQPLSGPDEVAGHVLVLEVLLSGGSAPDGRDPSVRRLLAEGLARHVDVLRQDESLPARAGRGPSWCRYQQGPWPTPHDPIVDFTTTPEDGAWLDAYARRAVEQIAGNRGDDVVVGHADWYAGNVAVADGRLVGTFDWELVADTEAVIAGFSAAAFAASSTSGAGLSTPEEARAFLQDYEHARGSSFDAAEQRAAAAAAAWILAFNARWESAMRPPGEDGVTTALVRARGEEYLSLRW
nr:phosphotransferase [Kineococcus siccus]